MSNLYASFFQHTTSLTFIVDHEGRFLELSNPLRTLLAYGERRVPDLPELLGRPVQDLLAGAQTVELTRGDGLPAVARLQLNEMSGGAEPVYCGELTPLDQAPAATPVATNKEARLHEVLDSTLFGASIAELNGTIKYANKALQEMFRTSEEEMIGRNAADFYCHASDRQKNIEQLQQHGWVKSVGVELKRSDGSTFWAAISFLKSDFAGPDSYYCWFYDLTYRHEVDTKMEQARELAEKNNRAKTEFLLNMSHEIRTPMHGILGMVSLLRETELQADQLKMLETIDQSGLYLMGILNDILDLSKIESGKLLLDPVNFEVAVLVDHALNIFSTRARDRGIRLLSKIDAGVPPALIGDQTRIQQIIINFISNAVKFTEAGEVALAVHCENLTDKTVQIRFSLSDTGIGIARENQEEIFRLFTQADASITRRFGGTGLGLTISSKLAHLMDGSIEVSSEEGVGSTFSLILPLRIPDHSEVADSRVDPQTEIMSGHPRIEVLLVEDNEQNQLLAQFMLEKLGYSFDIAENGQQALEFLDRKNYAVVLMDMQMPVMDGITATTRIVEKFPTGRPRIIAMTANAFAEDRQKCIDAGMDDFLAKPISLEKLKAKLNDHGL